MNIKYGMILAAGLGKRMQPLTFDTPKPLLEINNISLLERTINLLVDSGVQEISINVHYLPDQIQSFINKKKFQVKITISEEKELLFIMSKVRGNDWVFEASDTEIKANNKTAKTIRKMLHGHEVMSYRPKGGKRNYEHESMMIEMMMERLGVAT